MVSHGHLVETDVVFLLLHVPHAHVHQLTLTVVVAQVGTTATHIEEEPTLVLLEVLECCSYDQPP